MLRVCLSLSLAALVAVPAAGVIVTTAPGAPDLGMAAGETLLVTFDAANAAGVTDVSNGMVMTAAGSIGGVRAAPAGTPTGGVYRSIGTNGSSTFDFSGFTRGRGLASASFYWGSVDRYNFVDLINSGGSVVRTISGSDLPQFNGNQTLPITNRRVFFGFQPQEAVTAIRLRSTGNAFEFDNIAVAGAVPEPATWAMMIIGFGLVGVSMRKPKPNLVSA